MEVIYAYQGVDPTLASSSLDDGGFIIMSMVDAKAVMEGSNAVSVRWGQDFTRVRRYESAQAAHQSWELLTDRDDEAVVTPAYYWEAIWLKRKSDTEGDEDGLASN